MEDPVGALRVRALGLTSALAEAPDEETADRLADELDEVLDQISVARRLRPIQHPPPKLPRSSGLTAAPAVGSDLLRHRHRGE
jgi:hypothetical protein